ncbi:MAG: PEGA domain-containing protein [Hyphomonas sp.]|tara:strand:+ start:1919 stop:2371 length:453 start_codon:yes stop_codon:yes gene_type:complete
MRKELLLLPLAIALAGCATVTRGTTEAFLVETEPSGAEVTTSLGLKCGPTPCAIPKVKREAEFSVTIEKEGYKTTTHNITHQMSGGGGAGMAGNVILGGGIGAILDANNGATQELVPNPLKVTLEKLPEATDSKAAVEALADTLADAPGS